MNWGLILAETSGEGGGGSYDLSAGIHLLEQAKHRSPCAFGEKQNTSFGVGGY